MKKKIISVAIIGLFGTSFASQAALFDRGGGLIYDNDLNVTWLSDADYSKTSGYSNTGVMNWYDATTWAGQLTFQGYSDWRLPTSGEMDHLFYRELGGIVGASISTNHNPQYALFSNIKDYYWSSTENIGNSNQAEYYGFNGGGGSFFGNKISGEHAMAVRPGDIAAVVPEPETYAMMLAGLGLLGWRMRRVRD